MDLQNETIKELLNESDDTNYKIYKIILKDGTVLDKEYDNLKEAQEEAEELDAANVEVRYKYITPSSLLPEFLKDNGFHKVDWWKYENDKFYIKNNYGWHEENRQEDYFKMTVDLPHYKLGRYTDPYGVENYKTYLIVDKDSGEVFENEDTNNYTSITELKEGLKQVLNSSYGSSLLQPYYFDPLDF